MYNFFADINVEFIESKLGFKIPGLQVILILFVLLIVGFIINTSLGKTIFKYSERLITLLPVVKGVYGGIKQLTDTLSARSDDEDARIVLAEYPRKGIWQIGFVTKEAYAEIQKKSGRELINVLMPTSPNPTGGMLIMIPADEIIPLDMTYNEGMKYVVSGGVVTPAKRKSLKKR